MSFAVIENVAFDPADISFFPSTSSGRCGADRVVLEPDGVADLIEELLGTFAHFLFSIVG